MFTGTGTSVTHKVELRITASQATGATFIAADTISLTIPNDGVFRDYTVTSSDIPNIYNYTLAASTSYMLFIYESKIGGVATTDVQLGASSTANPAYTYSNGFSGAYLIKYVGSTSFPELKAVGISVGNVI